MAGFLGGKNMTKRPVSLTVIAVLLIVLSLLALVGVFTMGSNPASIHGRSSRR